MSKRTERTKRIGKYDRRLKCVPDVCRNGHKGKSQKGCFGSPKNIINKEN